MAWTAPATIIVGELMTAAFWNAQIRDNQLALRVGGFAILDTQATGDLPVAEDETQWNRLAAADGVPYYSGVAWAFINAFSVTYPVGSIYVSVVSTNPGTVFGVGTWTAIAAGRVMVCADGTANFAAAEQTGGANTVVVTTAMLPVHTHPPTDPGHQHLIGDNNIRGEGGHPTRPNPRSYPSAGTALTNAVATGISLTATGGGGAHNNLAPYIVAYVFKRTA